MNKLFLDTNVLIYSKDQSSSYHQWSINLLTQPYDFYTSSKNLSEYFAVVTKGEKPFLSVSEALQDLSETKDLCEVLYPSKNNTKLFSLISQHQPKGLLVHDFEIASIALVNNVKSIATINKNDFKRIEEIQLISF